MRRTTAVLTLALVMWLFCLVIGGLGAEELSGSARVEVVQRYRIAHAPGSFRPLAIIHDPKRELYCPTWRWVWGDEGYSEVSPDCDPCASTEDLRERWSVQAPRFHVFRRPGEYDITFELVSGDRVLRSAVRVVVHGSALVGQAPRRRGWR